MPRPLTPSSGLIMGDFEGKYGQHYVIVIASSKKRKVELIEERLGRTLTRGEFDNYWSHGGMTEAMSNLMKENREGVWMCKGSMGCDNPREITSPPWD